MSNFRKVGEYSHATKVLQPMTPVIPSEDIVVTLCQLHPFPSNLIPLPIFDYQPKHNFSLDKILFPQALAIAPHLFLGGLSRMVYEHLSRCFILEDPSLRFSKLFYIVATIVHGHIFKSVAFVLRANKLLIMAKETMGFHPIVVGEVFV